MNDFDYAIDKIAEAVRQINTQPVSLDGDFAVLLGELAEGLQDLARETRAANKVSLDDDCAVLLGELAEGLQGLARETRTANKLKLIEVVLATSEYQPKIMACRDAADRLLVDYDLFGRL